MADYTLVEVAPTMERLLSEQSARRLEQLASLSERQIGKRVALPQIFVCGDQSTGKSSVLEGLTGVPFPRQDGLCTRFATEIINRHTNSDKFIIDCTIYPGPSRSSDKVETFKSFKRQLHSFADLPSVISEAGAMMGIRGFGENSSGPAFAHDRLCIRVSGPTKMHLSVVDLPGLIQVPDDGQEDSDVETVHGLVDSYMKNERAILLAIVQAGNDIANQPILKKARQFDKSGARTVGIITKPDLINEGTEGKLVALASNKDAFKLKLGWFILKNPTPIEIARNISFEERHNSEMEFFKAGRWRHAGLDLERAGCLALRRYVQGLLDRHITQEMPKVFEEITNHLRHLERALEILGPVRTSPESMRTYLATLSVQFQGKLNAGSQGTYAEVDPGFFQLGDDGSEPTRRLRAQIHLLNSQFAESMRTDGALRAIRPCDDQSGPNKSPYETPARPVMCIRETEMASWIKEVLRNTRGLELPGCYNRIHISELFQQQCSRWKAIADTHVKLVHERVQDFVLNVLKHVVADDKTFSGLQSDLAKPLRTCYDNAVAELEELWLDEQAAPMTYNHYFTDNVQKSRQETMKKSLESTLQGSTSESPSGNLSFRGDVDMNSLVNSLQGQINVDMEAQTCIEARTALDAYYKVAQKTWVDNVARQVVERHLLRCLPSLFSPEYVSGLDAAALERLAGEEPETMRQREELKTDIRELREALEALQ